MDNRQEINMIGGGFQHSPSTSGYEPLYIKWVKGYHTAPISIYIDFSIKTPTNPATKNYAWLGESKTINPSIYSWCRDNIDYLKKNFILVFTHDVELSKTSDIFRLVQCSGKSFLPNGEIYKKNKLVSMIASNKTMCEEHRFRQQMIAKFANKCDHYGRGFKELANKLDGLKDYCFSITMENATYSNMFTEKISDCFMTGTIPVYYGIDNIGEFFNKDGIIILDNDFKIEDLSFELYQLKLDAVKENFKIANEMLVAEDYIYINHIKNEI
jgi:hypothetical protein